MTIPEGKRLISDAIAVSSNTAPQQWADLGCGDGFFTRVLASLLPKGSTIYAVDKQYQSIDSTHKVQIEFHVADFQSDDLPFPALHGILMANSLHYVKEKQAFIQGLLAKLLKPGKFVFVEYDRSTGNPWVPYPITYLDLRKLLEALGAINIQKLGEMPSMYGPEQIYACSGIFE